MSAQPAREWEGRPVEDWRAAWGLPRLVVYDAVDSTNDVALALAAGGAPHGTTVLADHQTRGRGQRGREWQAPPARGVLLSVVLRPRVGDGSSPGVLPVRVGLAVASVLEGLARCRARLKWPNDIMADGGKLGGILCEGALAGAAFHAVAGIGINVLQGAGELPAGIDPPATSLALLGADISRAALAGAIAGAVAGLGPDAARPLSAAELREFGARDILRDRAITRDGAPIGVARGLGADGGLLVESDVGPLVVHTGTIRLAPGSSAGGPHSRFRGTAK